MDIGNQQSYWNSIAHKYNEKFKYETLNGNQKVYRKAEMIMAAIDEPRNANVLEIGCGTGIYTSHFANRLGHITAIDISEKMISKAPRHSNVSYKLCDAHELPFSDSTFDAVIGAYILQYLNISKAIREIYRVLKPHGVVSFIEINALHPICFALTKIGITKRLLGVSKESQSFWKWELICIFDYYSFKGITTMMLEIFPYKRRLNETLERIAILKEFAGTILIAGRKCQ